MYVLSNRPKYSQNILKPSPTFQLSIFPVKGHRGVKDTNPTNCPQSQASTCMLEIAK